MKEEKNKNLTNTTKIIIKTTLVGLFCNIFISFVKLAIGYIGKSQAVISDGIHSLSDAITDISIILGVKYWSAPADESHPYGHFKIESITTLSIGIFILLGALYIFYESIISINKPKISPGIIAIFGPILSIFIKIILYKWYNYTGKNIKSSAILSNALEQKSDIYTSIISIISVIISTYFPQFSYIDNIGAFIISIFIAKLAIYIIKSSLDEIIDKRASFETIELIYNIGYTLNGIKEIHKVRTRKTGSCIHIDLHLLVDDNITVIEAHKIANNLQNKIKENIDNVIDVLVHIEPYSICK